MHPRPWKRTFRIIFGNLITRKNVPSFWDDNCDNPNPRNQKIAEMEVSNIDTCWDFDRELPINSGRFNRWRKKNVVTMPKLEQPFNQAVPAV
jgi:hypothetical protein